MPQVWAFAVAVAFVPGIYGAPFWQRWLIIAAGLAFVPYDLRRFSPLMLGCMAALLIWGALGLIWTPALYNGVFLLMAWAATFAVAIAVASLSDQARDGLLIAFAAGLALSSVLAIGQVFFGVTLVPQEMPPGGTFFSPEVFAETTAPVFVWCLVKRKWLLAALLAVGLILCHERAAAICAALGLLYAAPLPRFVKIALLIALGTAGFVAVDFHNVASASQRVLFWGTAVLSLTWRGGGLGWWFQAHPFPFEEYVHSDLLQAFVELGAPALALVALCAVLWDQSTAGVADRAMALVVGAETVVSFPLHMPAAAFVFAVAAGALARHRLPWRMAALSRRMDDGLDRGWAGAPFGSSLHAGRSGGGGIPVRSAPAQHAQLPARGVGQNAAAV